MENKKKEYRLPEEVLEIWDKVGASYEMRDLFAKLPFGFKRASRCALECETLKRKFWRNVRKVYPELKGRVLSIDFAGSSVVVDEGQVGGTEKHEGEP